jgi:pyruvate/2-oxoglutarate dehydrogenase complex dihydrolipoamide acyltransferase (E2) component
VPAVVTLLASCGGGDADPAAAPASTRPPSATSAAPTPSASPSASPSAKPLSPSTAADGRKLAACKDGDCEVVVKSGDVLRFGPKVKAEPRIETLTVLGVGAQGVTFALDSGMTTTANGGIEINNALSIETSAPDGDRIALRITRLR